MNNGGDTRAGNFCCLGRCWLALAFIVLTISSSAETLVNHVRGYTLNDNELVQFTYLLIGDDGRVAGIGQGRAPAAETVVDGKNQIMIPGLIDAHGHIPNLGFSKLRLDLVGTRSKAEAISRIADYAEKHPNLPWLQGRGWNQELWENPQFPTARDIDQVVTDRPVYLRRVDGHAGWANTRAMEVTHLADCAVPEGGQLIQIDGQLTGILIDRAESCIRDAIPPPTDVTIDEALQLAFEEMLSLGLTGTHDAGITAVMAQRYFALEAAGRLPVRIYAMLAGIDEMNAFGKPRHTDKVTVRSIKLIADGALGSRGAALIEPYSDDPENLGLVFQNLATTGVWIREARAAGYQVNVHAIGTLANRLTLDAFAQGGVQPQERHRIEHAQIVHPDDIVRFKTLGILPSVQPTHATSDKNMAAKRLGAKRVAWGYIWRDFLESGLRLPLGSDFPVERANPFEGLYAAVSRRDLGGNPPGGWHPDQAMSRKEAFKGFTLDAAYAAHQEADLGSLEPGKWADFLFLSADPFRVSERKMAAIKVLETWIAGHRAWSHLKPANKH